MQRWTRKRGDYLVKTCRLTDGEFLHLLVGVSTNAENDLDKQVYENLLDVRSGAGKAAFWVAGSLAFGAMSHFRVLKSLSASGLEVLPVAFSHVALLTISFSTAWFCFAYCKQTYLQSWFMAKYKAAVPSGKTSLLLRFPNAFWHFQFMPAAIGNPKNIRSARRGYGQLASMALVLVALMLFSLGSIGLWLTIVSDVWRTKDISHSTSALTIALSAVVVLLGWTAPFSYDWPRRYSHYGLVNLLSRRRGESLQEAHREIALAASRMSLIETSGK